jgi:hypothetical protein
MTPPGLRLISALVIAAQLASMAATASPAAAAPASGRFAPDGPGPPASRAAVPDGSFLAESSTRPAPRPRAFERAPVPFPAPAPDPLFGLADLLAFRAEDPADPADEANADEAPETPAPHTDAIVENARPSRAAAWWVWTGSAALVGLFIAGFAHDLSNETGPPPEEPELPYFPDTP